MQTEGQRALAGAAAGAVIADATDNNAITGAALGAAAGALYCDVAPNAAGCIPRY
ncbi:MAG: YMGG-like glycine zipper-containing protein [Rhodobacteraceae bacterium]|nr:YMGG-like glycine zipper-containing protein [Paracoccaceae bacterium]